MVSDPAFWRTQRAKFKNLLNNGKKVPPPLRAYSSYENKNAPYGEWQLGGDVDEELIEEFNDLAIEAAKARGLGANRDAWLDQVRRFLLERRSKRLFGSKGAYRLKPAESNDAPAESDQGAIIKDVIKASIACCSWLAQETEETLHEQPQIELAPVSVLPQQLVEVQVSQTARVQSVPKPAKRPEKRKRMLNRPRVRKTVPAPATAEQSVFSHSDDYLNITYHGESFTQTKKQRTILRILHEAHKRGQPVVHEDTLLQAIGSSTEVRSYFRHSPLWGTLVIRGPRKGTFQLNLPLPPASKSRPSR